MNRCYKTLALACALTGLLPALSSADVSQQVSPASHNALASSEKRPAQFASGEQVAAYLKQDYLDTAEDCGSSTRPAFLCSGVLFRATNPDTDYHSWDPSPNSVKSGGVSFSYLRADARFNKLAYGYLNGMILYPYFFAPQGKDTNLDVLCFYPIDADTVNRSGTGCGEHRLYPTDSGPCQAQGITTATQWYTHYTNTTGNRHQHQCAFTTSEGSSTQTADAFYQAILGMQKLGSESFSEQNELRLATWSTSATGYPENFPVQAFFYIYRQNRDYTPVEKGLKGAQHDQQDYYDSTGIVVPIIRMSLPLAQSQDASFTYEEADQVVSLP